MATPSTARPRHRADAPGPARDTSIVTYRARRDFTATREPPPAAATARPAARTEPAIFVVQKHDASRLHWDFRLEHGGVLWSWAVPRGPSLDPADKRLAMHVEDHPLDYASFTGTIPAGQYGAGTVELWDRGTWAPLGDPEEGLRKGEMKFVLDGTRLRGGFVLVRLKPRGREHGESWLLIKERDDAVQRGVAAGEIEATIPAPAPAPAQEPEAKPGRPKRRAADRTPDLSMAGVRISHPERELWPGVTKRDLADYWMKMADRALPGIAGRPLALVRCPDGIGGESFFQKHRGRGMPAEIRGGQADGAPYVAIDDAAGLIACAQMSAIELHAWGAAEADALRPDRIIFDLDPGEDIPFAEVVRAAHDVRERLQAIGLAAFCRTSGGKGLHVAAPLQPAADWPTLRAFSRRFAETMVADEPERFVAMVSKAKRQGHILVDWLRNGLGSTAIASYSPRARPGAPVATPLAWREVTARLDPGRYTLGTVPGRVKRQRRDPWEGFAEAAKALPEETA